MLYELTTLTGARLADIDAAAQEWMADASAGAVLGRWRTEIGTIGRLLVLRAFETAEALADERRRALLATNPFNVNGLVRTLEMETYEGLAFLPPAAPRKLGGVYEFRTYFLKPGGLPPTLAGWEAAIAPAKAYTDHLVINMFALDGRPRITHIWGFESFEQRLDLRGRHYAEGLWPPKGGPEQIDEAVNFIALAIPGSPLC